MAVENLIIHMQFEFFFFWTENQESQLNSEALASLPSYGTEEAEPMEI